MWHASTHNSSCLLPDGKFAICYLSANSLSLAWTLCSVHVEGRKSCCCTMSLLKECSVVAFLVTVNSAGCAQRGWCDWVSGTQHVPWSEGKLRSSCLQAGGNGSNCSATPFTRFTTYSLWLSATQRGCGCSVGTIPLHSCMLLVWLYKLSVMLCLHCLFAVIKIVIHRVGVLNMLLSI